LEQKTLNQKKPRRPSKDSIFAYGTFFRILDAGLHPFLPILCSNNAVYFQCLFWCAVSFCFAVWTLSGDFDAVVYTTVEDACGAMNAQVFFDSDFSSPPV
jgi:hypothetical protein